MQPAIVRPIGDRSGERMLRRQQVYSQPLCRRRCVAVAGRRHGFGCCRCPLTAARATRAHTKFASARTVGRRTRETAAPNAFKRDAIRFCGPTDGIQYGQTHIRSIEPETTTHPLRVVLSASCPLKARKVS